MKRIIGERDIKELLSFTDSNLSTYNLLYKNSKMKIKYFSMLFSTFVTICLCVIDIYMLYYDLFAVSIILLNIVSISGLFTLFINLKKYREKMFNHIQLKRVNYLKKYYLKKKYTCYELNIIINILNEKVNKNKKDIWGLIVILGALLLPLWSGYVEKYATNFNTVSILIYIMTRAIIISFLIIIVYFLSVPINYVLTFRQRKIENIIFLTKYIKDGMI